MNYQTFHEQLRRFPVFSLSDIRKIDPAFHRRRLSEWQKKGYLKKILKGCYLFTDREVNESMLFSIANKIYIPSYISFEMALSYYHLIPESVYAVTSAAAAKTSAFDTPLGSFVYRQIKPSLMFGYRIVEDQGAVFRIGDPEKVILDHLYLNSQLRTEDDFESLRINRHEFLERVKTEKLMDYLEAFDNKSLTRRVQKLIRFIGQ